jgi:GAF domain-containing protein
VTQLSREAALLSTFTRLADTLVVGYDVVDLLQTLVDTCRDVLGTDAAGILLADANGELEVIVSTSEAARLVETLQLGAEAGPCVESYRSGEPVSVVDLSTAPSAWTEFTSGAQALGFHAVHAFPLRLRETTIGSLNLFSNQARELDASDALAAQALADVATIGILQERSVRENAVLADQLQNALNRRVIIEQAKGVVAHTHGILPSDAFDLIRAYARSHRLPVSEVAAQLVNLTLDLPMDESV